MVALGPVNNEQPPPLEQVDGCTTSEAASHTREKNNTPKRTVVAPYSLVQALINILASKVKRGLVNQVLYYEIVTIMWDQATRIRELEQNMDRIWETKDE